MWGRSTLCFLGTAFLLCPAPLLCLLMESSQLPRAKTQTGNLEWNRLLTEENIRAGWPDSAVFHVGNCIERAMLSVGNKRRFYLPATCFSRSSYMCFTAQFFKTHVRLHRGIGCWDCVVVLHFTECIRSIYCVFSQQFKFDHTWPGRAAELFSFPT